MASYYQREGRVTTIPHGFSLHDGMVSATPHLHRLGFGIHAEPVAPPNPMAFLHPGPVEGPGGVAVVPVKPPPVFGPPLGMGLPGGPRLPLGASGPAGPTLRQGDVQRVALPGSSAAGYWGALLDRLLGRV